MTAWYNEPDPFAAQWLRNLISAGHIAPGIVDERPIQEIEAWELIEFTQCHFFAGIGVWSLALRNAGWPDDRPIWTGSCPCQPFSNAGKKKGFSDERHLWPYWQKLIDERKPSIIAGEQVASALEWIDLVSADMEKSSYAFGAVDLCAAGFDGAHIRQRNYFVGLQYSESDGREQRRTKSSERGSLLRREFSGLADSDGGNAGAERLQRGGEQRQQPQDGSAGGLADDDDDARPQGWGESECERPAEFASRSGSLVGGLADTESSRLGPDGMESEQGRRQCPAGQDGSAILAGEPTVSAPMLGRTPVDWLYCRDGKWRPVEPGTFPLVDAAPSRVGRLRAYGNALDVETATQFCKAIKEIADEIGV